MASLTQTRAVAAFVLKHKEIASTTKITQCPGGTRGGLGTHDLRINAPYRYTSSPVEALREAEGRETARDWRKPDPLTRALCVADGTTLGHGDIISPHQHIPWPHRALITSE